MSIKRDPIVQSLRNEVGQQTHTIIKMTKQRREMQADLVRQREDMADAIAAIDRGEISRAREILQEALNYRERTREPRKVKTP